jgi:murein DD-endopeptidase MepM/ murein hydrolase activator NlpD
MEAEIRRISSINDGTDSNPGAGGTHDGQGGPLIQPNIQNLSDTLDAIEKNIAIRKQSLEDLKEKISVQQEVIAVTPSIWPATGDVSSPYGLRWGGTDFHPGIDIANDAGTPIVATADGIVTAAGWNSGGYGNMVDIDHGNGLMTRYGHAQRVVVTTGQQVKRGQVIAYMGSTGFSTGPHVHYEVRVNGKPVNPSSYL